jgi:hypothetical protein
LRIDPKAPADSPHHPRNVAFAGMQERLTSLARDAFAEAGHELPANVVVTVDVTPLAESLTIAADRARLLAELADLGQEFEAAIGVGAANSFPSDDEPEESPAPAGSATAELETALADAGLVEAEPQRKKPASGTGAQRKPARKPSTPRKAKAKPNLEDALAALDAEER